MFKKIVLIALITVLSVSALPISSVAASGLADEKTPPEKTELTDERLEKFWERVLKINERVGQKFERADAIAEKIQPLLDKAKEEGKDTSAVEAALDAFLVSTEKARPIYEAAQAIITKHEGFDADGKVTDSEKAIETLKSLRESFKELKEITGESGKSLREAIEEFREANPRPERERVN